MIKRYAAYDDDGKILHEILCGEDEAKLQELPTLFMSDEITADHFFVKDGKFIAKQQLSLSINKSIIAADGVDTIIINNIPVNTTVTWWDSQQDTITDGTLEITSDMAGDYKIILDHPHYLQETINFEARN